MTVQTSKIEATEREHLFNIKGLLKNKHLQTVYATLFRKQIPLPFEVEVFELDDGDFVECYWLDKPKADATTPIAILFHGLEGSAQSPYIQGAMQCLQQQGFASVLMHFRGCSGKPNRLPRSYHSGDTADAKAWITQVRKVFPLAPLFAVGYSLGGNMLLKLLAEYEDASPFQAAVAVSAPMKLDDSADAINKGFSRIYERHLLKALKSSLLQKYSLHNMEQLIGKSQTDIKALTSIREFDDVYTARINGFEDAQDYYTKNSAKQFLSKIVTPTLIIHAADDPFMTTAVIPDQQDISNSTTLEIQKYGGHVGFVMGSLFKPVYYLDHRVTQLFQANLEEKKSI